MDLHRYETLKSELADLLRSVPWRPEQAERNRDLFRRLAEDRFNLAVVGRFSRGKSTLMNAMLGLDRLPTGIEPLTSVITSITYGSHEKVVLHYQDTSLFLDIRLDQLEEYVTERGNPGNRRRIREAEIQLPADLLRSGFRFIDTPGLGSPIVGNTLTTRGFLPEADAFLLVTGFDGPLTDEEAEILRAARRDGRRLFVVVNKADLCRGPTDDTIIELRERLRRIGYPPDQPVYPVSARHALLARTGLISSSELPGTGLPDLERDVIGFLTRQKRRAFLQQMCSRLEAILAAEPDVTRSAAPLTRLREELGQADDPAAPEPAQSLPPNLPDCGVCQQVEQAVFDALTALQGRLRRDPGARASFGLAGGLCGPHTREFAANAAPREICVAFAPVLDKQAQALRALAAGDPIARDAPEPAGRCLVCEIADGVAARSLEDLLAHARMKRAPQTLYATCCQPHLRRLAAGLADDPVLRSILTEQASILERRADDMRRFALKQDASLRDLISDEERRSAKSGIDALVGVPDADRNDARDSGPASKRS